jgi:hypothetical protein
MGKLISKIDCIIVKNNYIFAQEPITVILLEWLRKNHKMFDNLPFNLKNKYQNWFFENSSS